MTDEKIIAAIEKGDEQVISRVINRYSRLLWPIAAAVLKNVGCDQDIEECVADTFISLWEQPQKFDPRRGKLKTLLCIVVRSKAIDRYRQLRKKHTVPLENVLISSMGLQDVYLRREAREELRLAVEALEEPNREILVRRYYLAQKPKEIALALDMTVKQVGNSLYRSKRQLQEMMRREGAK